jgi:hypothetical protein
MRYQQTNVKEAYVYWVCDKISCNKRNYRRITKVDRSMGPASYSVHNDDICDNCCELIHEPVYIEFDPYKVENERY